MQAGSEAVDRMLPGVMVKPTYPLLLTSRDLGILGAGERNRTLNLLITNQLHYRCATPASACIIACYL